MQRSIGFAGFLGGLVVDYSLLHPDCGHLELNCLIHNLLHEFGAPENIHDVDPLRHVEQRDEGLLAQTLLNLRIHWNDAVAMTLHIG